MTDDATKLAHEACQCECHTVPLEVRCSRCADLHDEIDAAVKAAEEIGKNKQLTHHNSDVGSLLKIAEDNVNKAAAEMRDRILNMFPDALRSTKEKIRALPLHKEADDIAKRAGARPSAKAGVEGATAPGAGPDTDSGQSVRGDTDDDNPQTLGDA